MSKRESITRYSIIIKKLRRYPSTYQEILSELELESEIQSYNFVVSKRTFQRDLADIRSIYNIDIQYNYSSGVYYIDFDEQSEVQERIFEAFDTFNALNLSDRLSDYIHFEKRGALGTENLYGLLHAIKNKLQIKFSHQKYWDDTLTRRVVEPYALKEFKNRWYVLAKDTNDQKVKSFGLDRITQLEITKLKVKDSANFDINEYYKYSYGIISPNDQKPQEVILSFDTIEGKYIKSLPLHPSQFIIKETEEELQIGLYLVITHDFIMEILSHGHRIKVIEPLELQNELNQIYKKALSLYN